LADEMDRAQANDEFFLGLALRNRGPSPVSVENLNPPLRTTDTDNGQRLCIDCGEPIPAARLKAARGALRCVSCQGEMEKGRRQ